MKLEDIDLTRLNRFGGEFPHEWFRSLRAEAPVWYHPPVEAAPELEGEGFWVVSKHDDLRQVSHDWQTYSAQAGGIFVRKDYSGQVGVNLIMTDPPEQTRMRNLINKGFTPRMVRLLEDRMRQHSRRILDHVTERGECEFVFDVAAELPLRVIADILGVPEEDRSQLLALAAHLLEPNLSPEETRAAQLAMYEYARPLCEEKRRNPTDDILSILSSAEIVEEDGRSHRLTEFQIEVFFILLTAAGTETTRNATSGGLRALLEHPDQLERLRRDPALLDTAVEEILRWTNPVMYFRRTATRDTELRGQQIREGEKVTLWYPSANRDEEVFEDPFRFDVGRSPNPHVAFGGGGPHFCLGANLARLELRVIFEEILRRLQRIELAGEVTHFPTSWDLPVYGGYRQMPIRFEARAASPA
jgi:cholest-4-en-3-one 26-monooxygenase